MVRYPPFAPLLSAPFEVCSSLNLGHPVRAQGGFLFSGDGQSAVRQGAAEFGSNARNQGLYAVYACPRF